MTRILLYTDAIIMYFLDPVLQQLQQWTHRNNFWWAKKFVDVVHIVFAGYALFLIYDTQFAFFGVFFLCVNIIILGTLSMHVWKFLMRKIGKKYRRHTLQRERDRGMYYAMNGCDNPAIINLRCYRLRRLIEICGLIILAIVIHIFDSTLLLITMPTVLYAISITMWLYMRSATTVIIVCNKQKQIKKLHLLQLV
ncbi:MAG: hypothetical protein U9Q12_00615 [Patescibacteria group bacterium]|nr:hypothetical protein [Patescibacteria group bacterium]